MLKAGIHWLSGLKASAVSLNRTKIVLLLLASTSLQAEVPDNQKHEVNHLINFVQQSACLLERNQTKYPGAEAATHIRDKYDYYRDDIFSTEDFIKYSATNSMISGKPYHVHCETSVVQTTAEWLTAELKRYRKTNPGVQ